MAKASWRCRLLALTALGLSVASAAAVPIGADLRVVMLRSDGAQRSVISPGQPFTISIGVHNLRGNAGARNAALTLSVPPGLTVREARPPPAKTQQSGPNTTLTWMIDEVAAHAPPQLFEVDLLPSAELQKDAQVTLTASVSSDNDSDQHNNSFVLPLEAMPAQADLAVDSSLPSVPLTVGRPVKFAVTVSNWGTVAATASTLTATLPAGVRLQSSEPASIAAGERLVWQLGDIPAGDTRTVTMVAAVDARAGASDAGAPTSEQPSLLFTFDVATTAAELDPQDNHLEVRKHIELAGADAKIWLGVDAAAEPGELPVGKDVTFRVVYGNFGNAMAKDAEVSLRLWEGLRFASASRPVTRMDPSERFRGGVVAWRVGDVAVGTQDAIDCVVHVDSVPSEGALVTASIAVPGIDINPANNQAYLLSFASHTPRNKGAGARAEHPSRMSRTIVIGALLLFAVLAIAILVRSRLGRRA